MTGLGPGLLLLTLAAPPSAPDLPLHGPLHRLDAEIPEAPATVDALRGAANPRGRELGTPTTLYVNFDGLELDECNPSNSKKNCHWYNNDKAFPPFSGTLQTKVSVMQAIRRNAALYGIRVTGIRPPDDQDYTMVIYGGTEEEYGALGSAPSGDCGDQRPNQIAFAHMDGELNAWVNGGATTALHEAAHSWGLDHIDAERTVMFPAGNNAAVAWAGECTQVVANTDLEPGEAKCPELNETFCGDPNLQDARSILPHLFGPAYADVTPPQITLVEPEDGQYFQVPGEFDVVFDIVDDLHPQAYSMTAWTGDDPPGEPGTLIEPGFSVTKLPIGEWDFHVRIADEAGNETQLDFSVVVGRDPPPDPDMDDGGCACRATAGSRQGRSGPGFLLGPLLLAVRRKTR